MKNALNYYYGLVVDSIHQNEKTFYFKNDGYNYVLTKCDSVEQINEVYNLSINLLQNGVYCHQIILNSLNEFYTKINDENYILLKMFVEKNKINVNDVINFNNIRVVNEKLKLDNWYNLWTNKVDYLEYQISQIGKKYSLIRESFSYYIGMAETAISLIASVNIDELYYGLNHKRISYHDTTYDLYNPLNFVIDIRIRDICEYFKSSFFNNVNIENDIIMYLFYNKLNYNESCCFMARMLFPTYYFDIYEKIIKDELDEDKLNFIINKVDEYEKLLSKIYYYLKLNSNIPEIDWIKKVIQY